MPSDKVAKSSQTKEIRKIPVSSRLPITSEKHGLEEEQK